MELLSKKVGKDIRYIDDVAGPEAQRTIKLLDPGEAVLVIFVILQKRFLL